MWASSILQYKHHLNHFGNWLGSTVPIPPCWIGDHWIWLHLWESNSAMQPAKQQQSQQYSNVQVTSVSPTTQLQVVHKAAAAAAWVGSTSILGCFRIQRQLGAGRRLQGLERERERREKEGRRRKGMPEPLSMPQKAVSPSQHWVQTG